MYYRKRVEDQKLVKSESKLRRYTLPVRSIMISTHSCTQHLTPDNVNRELQLQGLLEEGGRDLLCECSAVCLNLV